MPTPKSKLDKALGQVITIESFTQSWAQWMLHAGWQAAVVAIGICVILKICGNRISSQFRYALLLIVLFKFAALPFLGLATGVFSQAMVAELTIPDAAENQTNISGSGVVAADSAFVQSDRIAPGQNSATFHAVHSDVKNGRAWGFSNVDWRAAVLALSALYAFGFCICIGRIARSYRKLMQSVVSCEREVAVPVSALATQITRRLGVRSTPELRLSATIDHPFVVGVFRPTIVIPRALISTLDEDQLEVVIAHEIAHIRRWDLVIGWIETVIGIVWWFHPGMGWLRRSLRQAREDCCDDMLLSKQITVPSRYCETLIDVGSSRGRGAPQPMALAFSSQEHPAGRRIRRLMDDTIPRSDRVERKALVAALMVALVTIPGLNWSLAQNPISQLPQNQRSRDLSRQPDTTQNSQTPIERLHASIELLRETEKKLEKLEQPGGDSAKYLRAAIDDLEKDIRQQREDRRQRDLTMLESRLRLMAAMQTKVLDDTVALAATSSAQRSRKNDRHAADLVLEENKITLVADRAILLLRKEGSSVAIPEVVAQIRGDTIRVADRLSETKVDRITQGIQNHILAAVEELIAAVQKTQRDRQHKQQQPGQGEQRLVEAFTELKLIGKMSVRFRSTIELYSNLLESGESSPDDVLPLLEDLSDRQKRLNQVTRLLVLDRNQ